MAKKTFTKYPSSSVKASSIKRPQPTYETVGDLKKALSQFPDDYAIRLIGQQGWGVDENGDLCFIKNIADYDNACEIEIF